MYAQRQFVQHFDTNYKKKHVYRHGCLKVFEKFLFSFSFSAVKMQINFRSENAAFECRSNHNAEVKIGFIEQTIKFTGAIKAFKMTEIQITPFPIVLIYLEKKNRNFMEGKMKFFIAHSLNSE